MKAQASLLSVFSMKNIVAPLCIAEVLNSAKKVVHLSFI